MKGKTRYHIHKDGIQPILANILIQYGSCLGDSPCVLGFSINIYLNRVYPFELENPFVLTQHKSCAMGRDLGHLKYNM